MCLRSYPRTKCSPSRQTDFRDKPGNALRLIQAQRSRDATSCQIETILAHVKTRSPTINGLRHNRVGNLVCSARLGFAPQHKVRPGGVMRRKTILVLAAIGASASCGSAFADDASKLHIVVTANETYDSNVAQSDAAAARARGIEPSDTLFAPLVAADLTLPFGLQSFFLKSSLGYDFYSRNRVLNSGTVDVDGGFAGRFRDCKAKLSGEYINQRTDLGQLALTVTRNIENTESIRLEAGCGREIGFGPTLTLAQQWSGNSAVQLFQSDFRSTVVAGGVAYRRPSFGELSLVGTYGQTTFPDRELGVGASAIQDGYRDYSIEVQYDRRLGARVEGTLKVGYTSLTPFAQGVAGYNGLDYKGDIALHVSSRLEAHLSAEQAIIPTNVSNSTYTLEKSYSGEVDYTVSGKLSLRVSGSDRTDRYSGAALVSGLDVQRQGIWIVSGTASYRLSRRFAVELRGEHQVSSADLAPYNFTDNRISLSISGKI
jgi:Putative beta-barrel porin 2